MAMGKLILTALLGITLSVHAANSPLPETARVELPALDRAKLSVEDNIADKNSGPFRYGVAVPLSDSQSKALSVDNGQWQTLDSGEMRWQGEVMAKGASTVDVLLKPFWLPQNAKVTVLDGTGKQIWGPFGHEQNNLANTLPLPMVAGETMRIELTVPADERQFVQLAVSVVKQGYRGFDVVDGHLVSKAVGGCNVDVICAAGDPYRDQIRGVVTITLGDVRTCTGTLINNTRGDRAALLLTARHCKITAANASGVAVYYNYQSPTCRPITAGSITSPPTTGNNPVQLGASMLATAGVSDFALLRLNGAVPNAANAYWLGWDRRNIGLSGGAAVIHQPGVEEKRISIENQPVLISTALRRITSPDGTFFTLDVGNALIIENWDVGTTEPGSSGSALLTRDTKRIVGTLSGGGAACNGTVNNGQEDIFGRLFTGWEGENTSATRLKDHLDPLNTTAQVLDGIGLCNAPSISLTPNLNNPSTRDEVTYTAAVSGGVAPYSYAWDIDGDGVTDRTSTTGNVVTTRYDRALSIDVRLSVTDGAGCAGTVTRAMSIAAPDLRIDTTVPASSEQLCGDGDGVFDPGERWRVKANVRNFSLASVGGLAQFSPNVVAGVSPLLVTQGAGVIGNLASGQTVQTSSDIKIPSDAACGSVLGLNYVAGIDDRAVSIVSSRLNLTIAATCNIVNSCPLPTQIPLRGGSFFNAARGGDGLVTFVIARPAPQLPLFFGAWFTAEPNRRSTWYVITGDLVGNQVSAQILKTKQTIGAPSFTVTNSEVGKAQINLMTPEKFLLSYQFSGGASAGRSGGEIMQHLFEGLSAAAPDITGHYYNPAESGWGQTYESYVSAGVAQRFILTYLYDSAGEPRWVLGNLLDSAASGPANSYEVHCPGCGWLDFTPTTKLVGTQSVQFPNGFGTAIVGTQFVLPAPLSGSWIKNATLNALSNRPN
jgi:hypothetical protein